MEDFQQAWEQTGHFSYPCPGTPRPHRLSKSLRSSLWSWQLCFLLCVGCWGEIPGLGALCCTVGPVTRLNGFSQVGFHFTGCKCVVLLVAVCFNWAHDKAWFRTRAMNQRGVLLQSSQQCMHKLTLLKHSVHHPLVAQLSNCIQMRKVPWAALIWPTPNVTFFFYSDVHS